MKKITKLLVAAGILMLSAACSQENTAASKPEETKSAAPEASDAVSESNWPSSTVQWYVPAASGGGTDLVGRVFTNYLNEKTKKGMVVTNQTAGSGSVAMETVRTAKPDGNNLFFAHTGSLITCATGVYNKSMIDDFTTIAYIPTVTNYCLVVNAGSPYQTIGDLIEDAKAKPSEVTFGVALGSSTHLMAGLLAGDAGVEFNYVEAGSDTEKVAAITGNHIAVSLVNPNNAKQFSDAGKIRVLATIGSTQERCPAFPEVPSLQELGYKSCTYSVDFVVWGPKDMADADVEKINAMFAEAVQDEGVLQKCADMNFPLTGCLSVEEGKVKAKEVSSQYEDACRQVGLVK